MRLRGFAHRVNDPSTVTHGLVSAGLVTGMALIEPRKLTAGRRVTYRLGVVAMAVWMVWASARSSKATEHRWPEPVSCAVVSVGAGAAVFGLAEAAEAVDARVHDGLVRAGVRKPRLWLAVGGAALSAAAWWAGRLIVRADADEVCSSGASERGDGDIRKVPRPA